MRPIKIGLIDDQKLFTSGLGQLLSKEYDFDVVFEAFNGDDLKSKLKEGNQPDVVTLDTNMPLMDGIATAKWLHEQHPNIKMLVLAGSTNDQTLLSMVRLGVRGWISKDSYPEELTTAIKNINEGMVYFPEHVTRIIVESLSDDSGMADLNLTEKDFLRLSATELTYREIAEKLAMSTRAVDALRDQLFEKLKIKSRVGLVRYAIKHRLADL